MFESWTHNLGSSHVNGSSHMNNTPSNITTNITPSFIDLISHTTLSPNYLKEKMGYLMLLLYLPKSNIDIE